jgi:hypothetical protein
MTQSFSLARLLGEGGVISGPLSSGPLTSGLHSLPRSQFAAASVNALGAVTLDWTQGEVQKIALNGAATIAVTNWPAAGNWAKLVLKITKAGAYNVTAWPAGTIWPGGTAPTITSGAGKRDCIVLMTDDAGATVWGSIAGQDYH